jgi:hypothetical protein
MAMPLKHNRPWTEKEIDQLKELYKQKVLHRDIASKLKRTLNAIESKAMEVGISGRNRKKAKLKK